MQKAQVVKLLIASSMDDQASYFMPANKRVMSVAMMKHIG